MRVATSRFRVHAGDGAASALACARAFSMPELLVCLGVMAVLVSLAAPAISGSMARARLTRDVAQMRSSAALVAAYLNDQREVFPFWFRAQPNYTIPNPHTIARTWYIALEDGGYIGQQSEIDPDGARRFGRPRTRMSVALCYSPEFMRPGFTVPVDDAVATPVRLSQVAYPSGKGLLLFTALRPFDAMSSFCCIPTSTVRVPVSLVDGSTWAAHFTEFVRPGEAPVVQDEIGMPVLSPWGGYLARDR
jgi:prepilin-type N-terminal cleavage/methylation domain-containing protein